MKLTRRAHLQLLAGASAAAAVPAAVRAASPSDHVVEMLNVSPDDPRERLVFEPAILHVQPGDPVTFVATDRGHNSQSDDDMLPAGGDTWAGRIGQDVSVTFATEGAYGYYCAPHRAAGMVGLILVGNRLENYEALKDIRQRGRARQRWEGIFAAADSLVAEARAQG